jgi:hypothetical protein
MKFLRFVAKAAFEYKTCRIKLLDLVRGGKRRVDDGEGKKAEKAGKKPMRRIPLIIKEGVTEHGRLRILLP